jgi:hypothetical protein
VKATAIVARPPVSGKGRWYCRKGRPASFRNYPILLLQKSNWADMT